MCRADKSEGLFYGIDRKYQEFVEKNNRKEFYIRKAELKKKKMYTNQQAIYIGIGNTHKKIEKPKIFAQGKPCDHEFSVYVNLLGDTDNAKINDIVEKVEFKLHDSYKIPHYTVKSYPFSINKFAHTEFEVKLKVYFKAWTRISVKKYKFMLDFSSEMIYKFLPIFHLDENVYKANTCFYKIKDSNKNKLPPMGKPNLSAKDGRGKIIERNYTNKI